MSRTVVAAVAELTGTEPDALEPLYRAVDPDALDGLFESNGRGFDRSPSSVSFSYCGCDVAVRGSGVVEVSRSGREVTKRWR